MALAVWTPVALMCAVLLLAGAHTARAGINVWTSHGPPGGKVGVLAIDPATPTTLYAATYSGSGVFKSTDAGATWNAAGTGLPAGAVNALAIDPVTPGTLYAGTNHGVFKSTDSGNAWNSTGLARSSVSVSALAIDANTPGTLYAGTDGGVFKSTDGGDTWNAASTGLPDYDYLTALAIDPHTPGTLYAGGYVVDPCSGCGYLINDDAGSGTGLFKSTDGGGRWAPFNSGLPDTPVNALAMSPTMPGVLHAGTNGAGVFDIEQVLPACVGDCDNSGDVGINAVLTLVNMALEDALPSACPSGVPVGVAVDIALIVQAVNNALDGCGSAVLVDAPDASGER